MHIPTNYSFNFFRFRRFSKVSNKSSNLSKKESDTLFKKLNKDFGLTFVIATHDNKVFDIGHQKMELSDGKLLNL